MSVRYEDIYTLYPYLREKYHFDDLTGLVPHTLNRWYRNVALLVTMPDALARHLAKNPHGPLVGDLAQLITWQSGIPRRDFAELSYLVAYLRGRHVAERLGNQLRGVRGEDRLPPVEEFIPTLNRNGLRVPEKLTERAGPKPRSR